MSLKTVLVSIEETALDALKSAGTVLESFVITEAQQLVAKVKQSSLGTHILNYIELLDGDAGLTGEQKMEKLLSYVLPDLQALDSAGGLPGLAASVESFAKDLCQSAYLDFKALIAKVAAGA